MRGDGRQKMDTVDVKQETRDGRQKMVKIGPAPQHCPHGISNVVADALSRHPADPACHVAATLFSSTPPLTMVLRQLA